MGNTVGLPACPRGNSLVVKLKLTQYGGQQPLDITGATLAFIANKVMDQKTAPPVYIEWNEHTSPSSGQTQFTIPETLTSTLDPGSYYWNIDLQEVAGNVTTIAAGTWPITPVPGLMSGGA